MFNNLREYSDKIFGIFITSKPNAFPYKLHFFDKVSFIEVNQYRHLIDIKLVDYNKRIKYKSPKPNNFIGENNEDLSLVFGNELTDILMKDLDIATKVGGKRYEIFLDKGVFNIYLR